MKPLLSVFASSILSLLALLVAATALNGAPMTNADVIKMVKAGIDESVIITSVQNAESGFDTSADGLIALSGAQVPKPVIGAIIARASAPTRATPAPAPTAMRTATPAAAPVASAFAAPTGNGLSFAYNPATPDSTVDYAIRYAAKARGWRIKSATSNTMNLEYKGYTIVVSYGGGVILIEHTVKTENWAKALQTQIKRKLPQ